MLVYGKYECFVIGSLAIKLLETYLTHELVQFGRYYSEGEDTRQCQAKSTTLCMVIC